MEQQLAIPLGKGTFASGKLRGRNKRRLIIFLHGLTDHSDATVLYNGARYFERVGFASFRYDQYSWKKDARKLVDCTVQLLASDLDKIVEYFRHKGFRRIYVVGHSIGAWLCLKSAKKDFDGVIFWDGSHRIDHAYRKRWTPGVGYIQKWGVDFALGRKWLEEAKAFPKPENRINEFFCPIKLIYTAGPGGGGLLKGAKAFYRAANEPKSFSKMAKADHNFCNDGVAEKLYQITANWLLEN